jgi:hypothetical protein
LDSAIDVDYKNIEEIGDAGDCGDRDCRLYPHAGYWPPAAPVCEARLPGSGIDVTVLSHRENIEFVGAARYCGHVRTAAERHGKIANSLPPAPTSGRIPRSSLKTVMIVYNKQVDLTGATRDRCN